MNILAIDALISHQEDALVHAETVLANIKATIRRLKAIKEGRELREANEKRSSNYYSR